MILYSCASCVRRPLALRWYLYKDPSAPKTKPVSIAFTCWYPTCNTQRDLKGNGHTEKVNLNRSQPVWFPLHSTVEMTKPWKPHSAWWLPGVGGRGRRPPEGSCSAPGPQRWAARGLARDETAGSPGCTSTPPQDTCVPQDHAAPGPSTASPLETTNTHLTSVSCALQVSRCSFPFLFFFW